MLSNCLRKIVDYLAFNDVSKLCFGTAAGFAIVGGAGVFANYLAPGSTRLNVLAWISIFYLFMGLLEPLRANRFPSKQTVTARASERFGDNRVDHGQADRAA